MIIIIIIIIIIATIPQSSSHRPPCRRCHHPSNRHCHLHPVAHGTLLSRAAVGSRTPAFLQIRDSDIEIMWKLKCAVCGKPAHHLCRGCLFVAYCSRKHQKLNWETHHSLECTRAYPPFSNPEPCPNESLCGVWYFPGEHPDSEYCGWCGEYYPQGICRHHGYCACQRWAVLACRVLSKKTVDQIFADPCM